MKQNKCYVFALVILAISVVFISVGISRGEPLRVMEKAVQVCLECIGIG